MDFRISIVVAMIALLTRQVSCQVSLTGNFNPRDIVIEGTVVTLNCTVEDRNNGFGATIINASQAIFDCPSTFPLEDNILFLRHSHMQSGTAICGELVSSRIVEVVQNETTSVYIAQINITTTISMNGGYVECHELGKNDGQQIQLPNIIDLLGPLAVEFPSNGLFFIYWNQANENIYATQISQYSINVTGEDCGNCTNLDRIVSSVTNQLSCTGWEPNGQVCNVTVRAVASVQQLNSSSLATVYLQTPMVPFLEELIPVYSYDREELQSVEIFLVADSTVDPNDLPITFQVNVERSSQDDTPINCSFNFSAKSKCNTTYAQKYRCGINFSVRRCSQLLFQQEQEAANYQIRLFAETSIGRSLSANSSVLAYANLAVQLLIEPQQAQEEFSYISIIFQQIHVKVSSKIKYGPNCQALDNQASSVAFIVTTVMFPVSITDKICFIVVINNRFIIQGNFTIISNETSTTFSGTSDLTTFDSTTSFSTNYDSTISTQWGTIGVLAILFAAALLVILALLVYLCKLRQQKKFV